MPKRKRPSSKKFRERYPRVVGKFYRIKDTNGGHPAMVYYCYAKNNTYFVQRFTQSKRKDRVKLLHNIDPESIKEQWLVKKPIAVKYDDIIYDSKYENYRIHKDDLEIVRKYQKMI